MLKKFNSKPFPWKDYMIEGNAEGACGGGEGPIFNVSNYKFPLWLVEVTLGCFSSCISLVAVKSNLILFRSGCAAHTVLVAQPILFRLRSPYCLGCAAHTGGNSDNKANSAQVQLNLPTRAELGKNWFFFGRGVKNFEFKKKKVSLIFFEN